MATLTVGDITPRAQYTASSGQTIFAYAFPIFADGDLKVYIGSTLQTLTTNYTVSGAATSSGGNVTLVTGAGAGDIVTIYRDLPVSRTSDYQTSGDLLAETLNDDFDKTVMMAQQNQSSIARSIRQAITDSAVDMELPTVSGRASKLLGFDSAGDVAVSTSTMNEVDSAVAAAFGAGGVLASAYQFTGDGTTTAFTLTGAVSDIPNEQSVIVDIDGVTQHTDTYTTSGKTVAFNPAPPTNADIQVRFNAYLGTGTDAASMAYTQGGTGSVSRTVEAKLQESVSVKDFGAGASATGDQNRIAFQAAFNTGLPVRIAPGTYNITGQIAYGSDGIVVDARGATMVFDGDTTGFSFGSSATDSLPNYTGFEWVGGTFKNANGAEVVGRAYFILAGIENFSIRDVIMEEVSNGGVMCRAGCRNGLLENISIPSFSSYTTLRGIWLNGSDASDYASDLVDFSTLERNTTTAPIGAIRNVTIRKCNIVGGYQIYLMNAQYTLIEDNALDCSTVSPRCITINTYSPYTTIRNNHLTSSAVVGNTGILVTQYSHNTLIEGNKFIGSWGNGRSINISYLAHANIVNNDFRNTDPITIASEMGGNGRVAGNRFDTLVGQSKTPGDRCMRIHSIGYNEKNMTGYGNTATVSKPWIFENNEIHTKNFGVQVTQEAAFDSPNNEVGIELVTVESNTFYNWDGVSNTEEYPLTIESLLTPDNLIHYSCQENVTSPAGSGNEERNKASDPNGTAVNINSTNQQAAYGAGTWTPRLTDNDSTLDKNPAYTVNTGLWVRNGNIVNFRATLTMSSLGTLTTTHAVFIHDLPYKVKNIAQAFWGGVVTHGSSLALPVAGTSLNIYAKANTNYLRIEQWNATTGTSSMLISELTASGSLVFSGSYEIEDLSV